MPSALALVLFSAGRRRAARMAMMAITTSNSTSVKAIRWRKPKERYGMLSLFLPVNTDIRICQVPELPKLTQYIYPIYTHPVNSRNVTMWENETMTNPHATKCQPRLALTFRFVRSEERRV